MFTGLVQAIGTIERCGSQVRIQWSASAGLMEPLQLGDSVAVDGVCLTVAALERQGFRADVSPETLQRSSLGQRAQRNQTVNLEPALRLADRLGGHLVSGHIDGTGRVEAIEPTGEAWRLALSWDEPRFGRYICDKGSIAVNGISLTVAGCTGDGQQFWIAVIPHTWSHTTLQQLRCGDAVNLEADLLAKYAERLLRPHAGPDAAVWGSPAPQTAITGAWLQEQGWG